MDEALDAAALMAEMDLLVDAIEVMARRVRRPAPTMIVRAPAPRVRRRERPKMMIVRAPIKPR
jgi:hypothetical protein